MTDTLRRILPDVQKPARYTGGEYHEIIKQKDQVDVRVAFCFPDTYELGMSNLGMRILYGVMNEMPGVWCERVFAPWGDMEAAMRQQLLPLWALESQDPVAEFDMVAFTVGYEMCYSNILNMLRLAGIPIYAKDRTELRHMVFAGGVCTFNPEPLAEFYRFLLPGRGGGDHRGDCQLVPEGQAGGLGQAPFFGGGFQDSWGVRTVLLYPYLWAGWEIGFDCAQARPSIAHYQAHRRGSGRGIFSHKDHGTQHGNRP